MNKRLKVALNLPLYGTFDYFIQYDSTNINTGMRVQVSFGKKELIGIVSEIKKHSQETTDRYKLKPINEIKFKLPDLGSRSKNCLYVKIENPDDELLFAIILKNFSDRQIKIEKKIINFIISRIDRSYRKIDEFIYKIDELSLKKKKTN